MRRAVAGLAVVALEEPAPEELARWVRELPESPPDAAPDVAWSAGPPGTQRAADGRWACSGSGHHLPAMLQEVLLARSASLLHACGLEMGGAGVVLIGATGAGKTLASTAAATDARIGLLSDDLVVVTAAGAIHAFPTPVAIRPYHQALLPSGLRAAQRSPARQSALLGRLVRLPGARWAGRAVRAGLRRRGGRVGEWARLVKTDYLALPTDRLVPAAARPATTGVGLAVVLDAAGPAHTGPITVADAVVAALAATYGNEDLAGAVARYGAGGYLDPVRHRERAANVVAAFLQRAARLIRVRVPVTADPADAQRYLLDAVAAHLPA